MTDIERLFWVDLGQDCPFYVAAATLKPDRWGRKRVVSGRGLSREEATRNCFFESIERQSAVFKEGLAQIVATKRELAEAAVSPHQLLLISGSQYQGRNSWNATVGADHRLPLPFNCDQDISWTSATSLHTGKTWFVPSAVSYLGYPHALEEGFPLPDSSGLASGTSPIDAAERALLELMERDAVSIWWYSCARRPGLTPEYENSEIWNRFSAWMKRSGREFWVLDLTHDLATPVVAAVSCSAQGTDVSLGFGSAQTVAQAALQAMGELVQFEATKVSFNANTKTSNHHLMAWCKSANIKDAHFLLPHEFVRTEEKIRGTLQTNLSALAKAGLEAHAVEMPVLQNSTSVVRVIVPGLRQIWPRYAAGRLYDVPFTLGWTSRPLLEQELNPVPILY